MESQYNCQQPKCRRKADFVCENDYYHRYCESCINVHTSTHKNGKIPIQKLISERESFFPEISLRFNELKSDLLNTSMNILKCLKYFTQNNLKELDKLRNVIINQLYDFNSLSYIKEKLDHIRIDSTKKTYFDDVSKEFNKSLYIIGVNLI